MHQYYRWIAKASNKRVVPNDFTIGDLVLQQDFRAIANRDS